MAFTLPITGTDPKNTTVSFLETAVNTAIEAVAAAAALGFPLYSSIANGLAGTVDGAGFAVFDADGLYLYANDAGTESLQGAVPLVTVTDVLQDQITAVAAVATAGQSPRDPVALIATSNISLSGEQTLDGTLTSTSRVAVVGQTDPVENGVYITSAGAWSRATDMDTSSEIHTATVLVQGGSTYGGTSWTFTVADPDTFALGTDDITATQVGDASVLQDYLDAQISTKAEQDDLDSAIALIEGRAMEADLIALQAGVAGLRVMAYAGTDAIPVTVLTDSDGNDIAAAWYDLDLLALNANDFASAPVLRAVGREFYALNEYAPEADPVVEPFRTDAARKVLSGWDMGQNKPFFGGVSNQMWASGAVWADWSYIGFTGQSFAEGAYGLVSGDVVTLSQRYSNRTFGSGERSARSGGSYAGDNDTPGTSTSIGLIANETGYSSTPDYYGESAGCMTCDTLTELYAAAGVAPDDRVLFLGNAAIGGNSIAALSDATKRAWSYEQMQDYVTLATAAGKTAGIVANVHSQGETDRGNGTAAATWKASTLAYFDNWDAAAMAATGQSYRPGHFLWQLDTYNDAQGLSDAQLEMSEERDMVFMVAPNYVLPRFSSGNRHPTLEGYQRMGAFTARAMRQWMDDRRPPDVCVPIGAVYDPATNEVRIRYSTPVALTLDTTTWGTVTDAGIRVTDAGVAATIGTVSVSGNVVTVPITSGTMTGAVSVRIGKDYTASGRSDGVYMTTIRDTTDETAWIPAAGEDQEIYHWSLCRILTATILERT